jgi:hypothetical protein
MRHIFKSVLFFARKKQLHRFKCISLVSFQT